MKINKIVAVAACALSVSTVQAVSTEGYSAPYASFMLNAISPDSSRPNDTGYGVHFLFGIPFSNPDHSVELGFFNVLMERDIDNNNDYQHGFEVNYNRSFSSDALGGFRPYVVGGIGLIEDDIRGRTELVPSVNLGGGALYTIPGQSWSLRADLRGRWQSNDKSEPNEDSFLDYHASLGVQFPLARFFGENEAAASSEVAVINLGGGRQAEFDSDGDGVGDSSDLCPGSQPGAAVDSNGCQAEGAAAPAAQPKPVPAATQTAAAPQAAPEPVIPGVSQADADGDGVIDAEDRCAGTDKSFAVDGEGCALKQVVVIKGVTFQPGSSRLTLNAERLLNRVAQSIAGQPSMKIEIAGHTDNAGSATGNLQLSQNRAGAVKSYLVKKGGIAEGRLRANGYGPYQPVASNKTARGREANRRVEFRILLEQGE